MKILLAGAELFRADGPTDITELKQSLFAISRTRPNIKSAISKNPSGKRRPRVGAVGLHSSFFVSA
jgi:hypothetical protein